MARWVRRRARRDTRRPSGTVGASWLSDRLGERAVLQATRAFLRVTSRAQAVQVLHGVIEELAGEVVPLHIQGGCDPLLLPVDVSLGVGVRAAVRTTAAADARMGRHLPGLLEDAALVADRADEAARSQAEAALDPLTRVVSQGQIARRLEATRSGAVVSVLDLDGFKNINDSRGHLAGDATLRRFGRHLRRSTRKDDFAARSGGDEFLIILEDVEISVAYQRMNELATSWADSERQTSTVSIGVAAVTEAGAMAAAVAADRAMYRAKRGGEAVEIARSSDEDQSAGALARDTYDAYLEGLTAADASLAVTALVRGADRGMPELDLLTDVIARAQRTVGEKWALGDWGIADEHAATLVAEQALTVITPPRPRPSVATRVVMACAEGETHTMPARLAAQIAGSPEIEIIVLGGSMPAADLAASLRVMDPAVLCVSATVATNLIGAYRCIQAARAEGVPVIVGGAAWGDTQHRARRLGASLMLTEVGDLAAHVRERAMLVDTPAVMPLDDEAILLERPPPALVAAALERWARRQQSHPTSTERRDAEEALDWIARHAAAAIACEDPSVIGDLLERQIGLVRDGVEIAPIVALYDCLAEALALEAPRAAALLHEETQRLALPPVRSPAPRDMSSKETCPALK